MTLLKRILKFITVLAILFSLQTATFFILGPKQLTNKVLSQKNQVNQFSDSAFVKDGYSEDPFCGTGRLNTSYLSLDLKNSEIKLREKLGVKYIQFADPERDPMDDLLDTSYYKYKIIYAVNAVTGVWTNFYNGYECGIIENLFINRVSSYKVTKYRWLLFFWVQTKNDETDEQRK